MKVIFVLIIFLTLSAKGYCQKIPPDFKLLVTLSNPTDLKDGVPGGILIDSINDYLLVEYDYNPTYLDLYDMKSWIKKKRIMTKGFVYLENSYFYSQDNSIYIDKGRSRNKYIRIDLDNYSESKVDCKDAPYGCPFGSMIVSETTYGKDKYYILINGGWYILLFDCDQTKIYVK